VRFASRVTMATLVGVALVLASGAAPAQDAPATNDYAIDLFRGPVLAPLRVTGLAGAFAGVGEGIPGLPANAASPAARPIHAVDEFDYDLAASLSVPLPIAEPNDFDNSGARDTDDSVFIYATGGALIQVGPFGAGALVELERYAISVGPDVTSALIARYHGLVGFGLLDGQLIVGGGVRALTMGIDAPEAALTLAGIAPQGGFLIRPMTLPVRFGATLRGSVDAGALGEGAPVGEDGVRRLGGLALPDRVVLPWEIESGFALMLGPRPLQRPFVDPDRDRRWARAVVLQRGGGEAEIEEEEERLRRERIDEARALPREHLLLTAAFLVTGPVDGGVGLEGFLAQRRREGEGPQPGTSGRDVNFSPRVGLQAEPLPDWLQTRFGTYYEPNRFEGTGRQHFTFGADLRVWSTRLFGLAPDGVTYSILGAVDLAPRYESISLGLGVWR
jgi:hypothetical protein